MYVKNIYVEGDNQVVICILQSLFMSVDYTHFHQRHLNIRLILNQLTICSINHIFREANNASVYPSTKGHSISAVMVDDVARTDPTFDHFVLLDLLGHGPLRER